VASGTQYLFADTLGSTRMVITSTSTSTCVTSRLDYLPFGYEVPSSVGLRQNITDACAGQSWPTYSDDPVFRQKFTGKERDAETGLDYFLARYYSGAQGRFTSPDDVMFSGQTAKDPQSWNLYSYVLNNPLRFVDPTGRECVTLDSGATGDDGKGKMCQAVLDADKNKKPDVTVTAEAPRSEPPLQDPLPDAVVSFIAADLGGSALSRVFGWIGGRISSAAAPAAVKALAKLGRPAWAESAGGFVNWLKNLQRAGKSLTADEADAIISEAQKLKVDVRLDPPHPGTDWDVPHLNIGKEGQAHLEVPSGYDNAAVPKGSARKP
jgi:RHS repeat-associated protein